MPRWPGGHRAGPKAYSPGFEYRLGLFFVWTEAPHGTETHLRKKRLVCDPYPLFKSIIWPNSCATLNHLHCGPETFGSPTLRTSQTSGQFLLPNLMKENAQKAGLPFEEHHRMLHRDHCRTYGTCRSWIQYNAWYQVLYTRYDKTNNTICFKMSFPLNFISGLHVWSRTDSEKDELPLSDQVLVFSRS